MALRSRVTVSVNHAWEWNGRITYQMFSLSAVWSTTVLNIHLLGFKDVGQRLGSQMGNFTIDN